MQNSRVLRERFLREFSAYFSDSGSGYQPSSIRNGQETEIDHKSQIMVLYKQDSNTTQLANSIRI